VKMYKMKFYMIETKCCCLLIYVVNKYRIIDVKANKLNEFDFQYSLRVQNIKVSYTFIQIMRTILSPHRKQIAYPNKFYISQQSPTHS
jgi:hypothetical protein